MHNYSRRTSIREKYSKYSPNLYILLLLYSLNILLISGQQDDARMNLAIALTAARHGATIANHVSVQKLYKTAGKLSGARVKVWQ